MGGKMRAIALGLVAIGLTGCGDDAAAPVKAVQEVPSTAATTAPPTTVLETTTVPTTTATTKPATTLAPVTTAAPVATTRAVFYANCTEVKNAGKAPIRRGDPGYSTSLDRDGDGIACET